MAALGFDKLLEYLLDQITYCGTTGANTADFKRFVTDFYDHEDAGAIDELDVTSTVHPKVQVDRHLQNHVWGWLVAQPGVYVGDDVSGTLTLDAVEGLESRESTTTTTTRPSGAAGKGKKVGKKTVTFEDQNDQPTSSFTAPRVHVSEARIWKALTGHEKDLKKVPITEFQLLSRIAFAGPEGILQPVLVIESGQDKRSVPKRTDQLHAKGYIEKRGVLSSDRRARTSLLTLKRLVKQRNYDDIPNDDPTRLFIENGTLDYLRFLDFIMNHFRQYGEVIALSDLYRDLDAHGNVHKWRRTVVVRALKRLCAIGVTERMRAKDVRIEKRWHRSLRLIREPTEADREAFSTYVSRPRNVDSGDSDDDEDEGGDEQLEREFYGGDEDDDNLEEDQVIRVPTWTSTFPITNQLFRCIESGGSLGLTSLMIRSLLFGQFWKRPMETLLSNLTSEWQINQPPHLQHLAIVRDTEQSIDQKGSHYLYRSYAHYASLVDEGLVTWDTVIKAPEKQLKKVKTPKRTSSIDAWGFPQQFEQNFVSETGTSSLAVGTATINLKSNYRLDGSRLAPKTQYFGGPRIGRPPKNGMSRREIKEQAQMKFYLKKVKEQARHLIQHAALQKYSTNPDLIPHLPPLPKERSKKAPEAQDQISRSTSSTAKRKGQTPKGKGTARGRKRKLETGPTAEDTTIAEPANSEAPATSLSSDHHDTKRRKTGHEDNIQESSRGDINTTTQSDQVPVQSSHQDIATDAMDVTHDVPPNVQSEPASPTFEDIEAEVYRNMVTEDQVESLFRQLLRKEIPGLYIEPPGSERERAFQKQGRPGKRLVVVFRFPRLAELEWFRKSGKEPYLPRQQSPRDLPPDLLKMLESEHPESWASLRHKITPGPTQNQLAATESTRPTVTHTPEPDGLPEKLQTHAIESIEPVRASVGQFGQQPQTYVSPYGMVPTQAAQPPSPHRPAANGPPPSDQSPNRAESSASRRRSLASQTINRRDRKKGVRLGEGNTIMSRAQLVMEIVKIAGGLFPAFGAMNTAYKTLFRQRVAKKATDKIKVPDHKTIGRAVKDLVHNQQLVKMVFSFKKNGLNAQRGIVALPHFRPESPEIRHLQMQIIERYPDTYYPPGIHHLVPPSKLLHGMRGTYREILPTRHDYSVQLKHPFKKDLAREEQLFERTQRRKEETARRKAQKKEDAQKAKEAKKQARIQRDMESKSKVQLVGRRFTKAVDQAATRMRPTHNFVVPQMLTFQGITLQTGDVDQIWMPDSRAEFERLQREEEDFSDDDSSTADELGQHANQKANNPEFLMTCVGDAPVGKCLLPKGYKSCGFDFLKYVPRADMSKSLMLPKRPFHPSTGTFGTAYEPWRYAYDIRFLKDETEHSFWEAGMPRELTDIRPSKRFQEPNGPEPEGDRAKINRIIDGIRERETRDIHQSKYVFYTPKDAFPHNPYTPRLRTPRFMHHTIPAGMQVLAPYKEPKWAGASGEIKPPQLNNDCKIHWDHNDSYVCVFPNKPPEEEISEQWKAHAAEMKALREALYAQPSPAKKQRRRRRITNLVEALTKEKGPPMRVRKKRNREVQKRKKFGPRDSTYVLDAAGMKKLLYAAVVVKVIAGGTRAAVPWHLIYFLFRNDKNLDLMVLKNRLMWIDHHYSDMFQKLLDNFREAFIPAYERGEVPEINFKDLEHYDWDFVLEWAMSNLNVQDDAPELPQERSTFDEMYELEELPAEYLSRQKARFFKPDEMIGNRRHAVHLLPFAAPLEHTPPKTNELLARHDADVALGKSWLRANTTTPVATYDKYAAMEKLSELGDKFAQMSVNALIRDKVFQHRTKGRTMVPGRNYQFTNQFEKTLRADVAPGALAEAAMYKLEMDKAFTEPAAADVEDVSEDQDGDVVMISERSIKPRGVPVSQMMKTNVAVVNLNLLAAHRVRLSPDLPRLDNDMPFDRPRGVVVSKWGFARGNYSTRKLPREAFHWDINVVPTDKYETGLLQLPIPPSTHDCMRVTKTEDLEKRSAMLRQKEHIPLWRTLNDQMIPHWWARFAACVLNILATRAPIRSSHIASVLNKSLDEVEIDTALQWLQGNKVIRRMPESHCWVLNEGWWSTLGSEAEGFGPDGDRWIRDVELKVVDAAGADRAADDLSRIQVGNSRNVHMASGYGDVRYGHETVKDHRR